MKISPLILLTSICATPLVYAEAETGLESDFKQAYQAYQLALNGDDVDKIKATAKLSYETGCAFFDRTDDKCFTLTSNYAQIMAELEDFEASEDVYRDALDKMSDEYGDNSIQVGELILSIMDNLSFGTEQDMFDFVDNSLSYRIGYVADELKKNDPKAAGLFWLKAIQQYNRLGFRNKREILEAYELLKKGSKEESEDLILCRYMAANYYFHKRKLDDGIELYEENIKAMEKLNLPSLRKLEIKIRGLLISSYTKSDQMKKAEKQIVGLAKITPWSKRAEPIYRTGAEYPEYAWNNNLEGRVILSFDLDKYGRPKNIKVVSADEGNTFKRSAMKSLRKWRFLPKFENGKAVEAKDLQTSIAFGLAK